MQDKVLKQLYAIFNPRRLASQFIFQSVANIFMTLN